jgi:hypothetical protein
MAGWFRGRVYPTWVVRWRVLVLRLLGLVGVDTADWLVWAGLGRGVGFAGRASKQATRPVTV